MLTAGQKVLFVTGLMHLITAGGADPARAQTVETQVALSQQGEKPDFDCLTGGASSPNICFYQVKKALPARLIEIVTSIVFDDIAPLGSPDAKLKQVGSTDMIQFWHKDPIKLDNIKSLLKKFDVEESYSQRDYVKVNVNAYVSNDEGMRNLGASLTSFKKGESIKTEMASSPEGFTFKVPVAHGALTAAVSAGIAKGQIRQLYSFGNVIRNLQSINARDTENKHKVFPGVLNSKDSTEGMTLSGTVSIDRESRRVNISGFSYYLGRKGTDPNIPRTFQVTQDLTIPSGTAHIISQASVQTEELKRSLGLFSFGRSRVEATANLLVVVSAEIIPYQSFEERNAGELIDGKTNQTFSDSDLDQYVSIRRGLNLENAFDSLAAEVFMTPGTPPILAIRLNKDTATRDNFDKLIKITVSGPGIRTVTKSRELQNLMAGVFRIPDIDKRVLASKEKIELQVTLESDERTINPKISRTIQLTYIPETGRFKRN